MEELKTQLDEVKLPKKRNKDTYALSMIMATATALGTTAINYRNHSLEEASIAGIKQFVFASIASLIFPTIFNHYAAISDRSIIQETRVVLAPFLSALGTAYTWHHLKGTPEPGRTLAFTMPITLAFYTTVLTLRRKLEAKDRKALVEAQNKQL